MQWGKHFEINLQWGKDCKPMSGLKIVNEWTQEYSRRNSVTCKLFSDDSFPKIQRQLTPGRPHIKPTMGMVRYLTWSLTCRMRWGDFRCLTWLHQNIDLFEGRHHWFHGFKFRMENPWFFLRWIRIAFKSLRRYTALLNNTSWWVSFLSMGDLQDPKMEVR